MTLLKEIEGLDLKKSDKSDAGSGDVSDKAKPNDISFSLMRNTINSDGEVTGSDVADYLEKAADLNDEIETVPFALETDDDEIVKVYVNAKEAEKFEAEMKKLLGVEDDIEAAINKLALEFDIVDVVWPGEEDNADKTATSIDDEEFSALSDLPEEPEGTPSADEESEYDPL